MQYVLLLLDDHAWTRRLFGQGSRSGSLEVITASDVSDATRKLFRCFPHALAIDIHLGKGVTGLDWLESVRAGRFASIPVAMMTQSNGGDCVRRALSLGADDYIIKKASTLDDIRSRLEWLCGGASRQPLYRFEPTGASPLPCRLSDSSGRPICEALVRHVSDERLVVTSPVAVERWTELAATIGATEVQAVVARSTPVGLAETPGRCTPVGLAETPDRSTPVGLAAPGRFTLEASVVSPETPGERAALRAAILGLRSAALTSGCAA